MLAYIISVVAGIATPMQTSLNSVLRDKIGAQYITTLISFTTSIITLVMILLLTQGRIFLPIEEISREPWWIWTGGLCGVAIVVLCLVCLPKLGSAKTVTLMSFGQIVTSLVTDQWGMFKTDIIPMTVVRLVGGIIVLIGVIMVSREPEEKSTGVRAADIPYIICGLVCGAACGLQIAINGTLGRIVQNSFATALLSMLVAWTATLLICVGIYFIKGKDGLFTAPPGEFRFKWWMLTGGLMSVIIVSGNAMSAPLIGAGLVTIMNLGGQMGAGIVIDAIGFLGIPKKKATAMKLLGMVAMIAGTAIISLL